MHARNTQNTQLHATAGSAKCRGGTEVDASQNYWKVEELEVEEPKSSTRRRWANISKVFKLYRCEPGMCNGSNTCNRGRIGVVCGRCPDNHALEAGVCVECNVTRDPAVLIKWQAAFGVVVFLLASVVWFLFAWAPLFGGTAQSFFMVWFAWCVVYVVKHFLCSASPLF